MDLVGVEDLLLGKEYEITQQFLQKSNRKEGGKEIFQKQRIM